MWDNSYICIAPQIFLVHSTAFGIDAMADGAAPLVFELAEVNALLSAVPLTSNVSSPPSHS